MYTHIYLTPHMIEYYLKTFCSLLIFSWESAGHRLYIGLHKIIHFTDGELKIYQFCRIGNLVAIKLFTCVFTEVS